MINVHTLIDNHYAIVASYSSLAYRNSINQAGTGAKGRQKFRLSCHEPSRIILIIKPDSTIQVPVLVGSSHGRTIAPSSSVRRSVSQDLASRNRSDRSDTLSIISRPSWISYALANSKEMHVRLYIIVVHNIRRDETNFCWKFLNVEDVSTE